MPFVRHEKCPRCKGKKVVLKKRTYSALEASTHRRHRRRSTASDPACL